MIYEVIKSLISANEGGRHAAWAHKLALVHTCFVNLSKSCMVFGPQSHQLVDLFCDLPTLKSMILIWGEMI